MLFFLLLIGALSSLGLVAGLLSGLVGLGGGIILVPGLLSLLAVATSWAPAWGLSSPVLMPLVIGTSLGGMIFTTLMAAWSHHQRTPLAWGIIKRLMPGILIGAMVGVWLTPQISAVGVRALFAGVCFVLGGKFLFFNTKAKSLQTPWQPSGLIIFLFSFLIGILSGLLGLGGGILTLPLLLRLGFSLPQSSATSAAMTFQTVLVSALAAIITGWHTEGLPPYTIGYIFWPASLLIGLSGLIGARAGVRLAHYLPPGIIKRVFGGLVVLIGLRMLPIV